MPTITVSNIFLVFITSPTALISHFWPLTCCRTSYKLSSFVSDHQRTLSCDTLSLLLLLLLHIIIWLINCKTIWICRSLAFTCVFLMCVSLHVKLELLGLGSPPVLIHGSSQLLISPGRQELFKSPCGSSRTKCVGTDRNTTALHTWSRKVSLVLWHSVAHYLELCFSSWLRYICSCLQYVLTEWKVAVLYREWEEGPTVAGLGLRFPCPHKSLVVSKVIQQLDVNNNKPSLFFNQWSLMLLYVTWVRNNSSIAIFLVFWCKMSGKMSENKTFINFYRWYDRVK